MDPVGAISRGLDAIGIRPDRRARQRLNTAYTAITLQDSRNRYRNRFRPSLSYSQFGEDACIQVVLSSPTGHYVDIGAGDPVRGSNTFALYRRGWTGVLIDPIASNVEAARRMRKRDKVIRACVTNTGEPIECFEYEEHVFSTTSPSRVELLKAEGRYPTSSFVVPSVRLSEIGVRASPRDDVLLNIDVEGTEMSVLESNDWGAFVPAVIAVEEWDGPLGKSTPMLEYLGSHGYHLVAVAGMSSLYVHGDFEARHWPVRAVLPLRDLDAYP